MTAPDALVALALTTPYLVGRGLLGMSGLSTRRDGIALHAHALLAGMLVVALVTFAWLALGRALPARGLAIGLSVLGSFAWWRSGHATQRTARRLSPVVVVTLIAIGAVMIDLASVRNLDPILMGDEANIWASKAKCLISAEGIGVDFALRTTFYPVQHPDYPLLVPLLHAWLHGVSGEFVHFAPRVLAELGTLAGFLILAGAFAGRVPALLTIAVSVALLGHHGTGSVGTSASADWMVAFGLLAAVDGWSRFQNAGRGAELGLVCIGLSATGFAKNEGVMLVASFAAACAVALFLGERKASASRQTTGTRSRARWLWLVLPLAVIAGQSALNRWWGFGNDLFGADHPGLPSATQRLLDWFPERIGPVAESFARTTLLSQSTDADHGVWNGRLLLTLGLLAPLLDPRAARQREILVPWLCVLFGIVGYLFAFVITPNTLSWHLETAAARVLYQVTPVAVFVLGRQLGSVWSALRSDPVVASHHGS